MANNYYGYQYDTSPRKLQPEYKPNKNRNNKNNNKSVQIKKDNKKGTKKANHKLRAVKYLTIGFLILFAISYRNSVINESFKQKEKLKKELSALQKTNEQLQVSIENSLNLNNVEQSAKEKLGMQKPTNSQKVYVSLPKKDYIRPATEEVLVEEEKSWFEKLIKGFTKSIK
ncbi:MAG: hypothetical protein HFJ20_01270 [Clostridia bacterium]|nr:hypothetical protein [Clostridia bacterium]